jgi:transcriptional regulator with XRE-family HTH domain
MQTKTFIGPRLRRLRLERGETQAQMAAALGVSASYVNLLENNQRSVSVQVLLKLMETYGVDWRDIADDEGSTMLADLRAAVQDPLLEGTRPDLAQLRAALVHAPTLAAAFLKLHQGYQSAAEQLLATSEAHEGSVPSVQGRPEAVVHNFFRRHRNHFRELEEAADAFWNGMPPETDDTYGALKQRLQAELGISVRVVPVEVLPNTLRFYDQRRAEIVLSQASTTPTGSSSSSMSWAPEQLEPVRRGGRARRPRRTPGPGAPAGRTRQLLRRGRADALCRLPRRGDGREIRLRPARDPLRGELRAGLSPGDDDAARGRAGRALLLHADRQGRQRHQAVQRDRLPPRRVRRRLPAARRAYLLPDAGADRAAVRRDARQVAILRLLPHRGPADLRALRPGQPACRRHGVLDRACRRHRLCRGLRRAGHADGADRDQLPDLPARELRPEGLRGGRSRPAPRRAPTGATRFDS